MKKSMIATLMISAALTVLAGCASTTLAKLVTPAYSPYVQVAADLAVAGAVGTDASTQKAKAMNIKQIAQQVLAADTGVTATLAELQTVANAAIAKAKLPVGDVQAAQVLMAALSAVIQTQIAGSATAAGVTSQTQVAVALVLNDVITATSAYGA